MPTKNRKEGGLRRLTVLGLALALMAGLAGAPALAQDEDDPKEKARVELNAKSYMWDKAPYEKPVPEQRGWVRLPTPPKEEMKKHEFMPPISAEAKMRFMQSMMALNPFSLKDMINMMAAKKKAAEGLSFDEVVESLKLKGNELNMRFVGVSAPWRVIREIYDPKYPRVEIFSFCDLETLARILEYSPEFIVFIPCRIAVMEDRNGDIWLVTLDWDIRWLNTAPNPNRISEDLYNRAKSIRERMEKMMEAAANGDL